ncbi:hypothetical protein [Vaginisenegalia massiliensis]|uniref:hypothetical protein n=1 Tax=Vaginisenegalia massiliensis TaxID=2058294 RepID=UPI000F51DAAF|nr:hypothetical protein [Vaginisenegalia massiliensis]
MNKVTIRKWQFGKLMITGVFALVFLAIGLLLGFFYLQNNDDALLFGAVVMFAVGLPATVAMIRMVREQKVIGNEFYSLDQGRGSRELLDRARQIESRLKGTPFFVETNEDGIRILSELTEKNEASLTAGRTVYKPGVILLKTGQLNKYKQLSLDVKVEKDGDTYQLTPFLIGGKQMSISVQGEVNPKDGTMTWEHFVANNENDIDALLKEIAKQDGWKTGFNAEANFALLMALLGGGGALLTIIGFIIRAILGWLK